MRYFIELSYRGTAYHGWQTQANGLSVQITLEAALTQRLGTTHLHYGKWPDGCGRSCETAVCAFRCRRATGPDRTPLFTRSTVFCPRILPFTLFFRFSQNDHARFSAISRYYQYHITRQKNAFQSSLTYHFRPHLDIDRMNEACATAAAAHQLPEFQ